MGEGAWLRGRIAPGLQIELDPAKAETHGLVSPDHSMPLDDYRAALAATQGLWSRRRATGAMKLEFSQNPAFRKLEERLRELHKLLASGEGDGDAADAIREEMASDYRALSSKEVDFLQGLSEDLDSLNEGATPKTSEASRTGISTWR